MAMTRGTIALAVLLVAPVSAGDKPCAGPPWKTDYREARREALRTGKPLFVYFTKTH